MGCENCDAWIHIKCCGISPQQYVHYQAQTNCDWTCPICSLPNFSDSFFAETSGTSSTNSSETEDDAEVTQQPQREGNPRKSQKLKLTIINVNSIKSSTKQGMFHAFINEHNPDIIIANETEVDTNILDNELLPSNYRSIRKSKGPQDRGVMIIHKDNLIISEVKITNPNCEMVLAKLQILNNPALYLCSFYRHTNSDQSSLKILQENLRSPRCAITLCTSTGRGRSFWAVRLWSRRRRERT